ncbi:hypothetical protein BGZ50_002959 [Haplosporangium sp. Z 11]|nr:hypothetical protein BGZ50_002959 [Haplosporangium sp. Z 11]
MCVAEASPALSSPKHTKISTKEQTGEGHGDNIDDDNDFDWEEDKVYTIKELQGDSDKLAKLEDDICCSPLHRRIHPWVASLVKNAFLMVIFLIPKLILNYVHSHYPDTIILVDDGKPYMAVVIGNHLGYFVIQFLIMVIFKVIHKFGTVKVKITLETHDALVPHIARSAWLFALIAFWSVFVHHPNCHQARNMHEFLIAKEENVDMFCRKWILWWVYRCLWGIQGMNVIYILKRYTMQILSDRFEQDNSKFVELNFQGHVLDGLQKIRQPRGHNRLSGLYAHSYRWAEKPTSWLATAYQGGRSPSMSRPTSAIEEKPPTATLLENTTQKCSLWQLMLFSFRRRANSKGGSIGPSSSPSGTMVETDKDHELEPQEFVKMSKKRKSKLIRSLRNKPIENPYKRAKELWNRICPPHRSRLERVDLEASFKKETMDRVWKLFDPNGDGTVTRAMFKQAIVDMVNLRKSFTSTHKTFENAMAKLNMLFNIIFLLFVIVAFLISFDVGVQQYAVGISSLVVGGAFVTGTSAKNAFESMVFIFVMRRKHQKWDRRDVIGTSFDVGDKIELDGAYFTISTIHILTTEMKRGDGMKVLAPNYVLAARHIHNLSRSDEHIENVWMDIPLFSSARTIQRLKQKIQAFVEGEAVADFHKIDVILNATNNHTKDGTSKACLQILFRVFHRGRWVDSEFAPRKLKAILFLRATLNELEQEDLTDLIALRRSLGYGNHGESLQHQPVLNEAGEHVGRVGASGYAHDSLSSLSGVNTDPQGPRSEIVTELELGIRGQDGLSLAHMTSSTADTSFQSSSVMAQDEASLRTSGIEVQSQPVREISNRNASSQVNHLAPRHVLVPETIQLSINAANFQPFPNGSHFQR